MDSDELLSLLDLSGKDAGASSALEVRNEISAGPAASAGPTALDVDDWTLRRGQELLDESERFRGLGFDAAAAADFFAAGFEPEPRLLPACRDAARHAFLRQMLETPEYRALHTATALNDSAAEIAAVAFGEQFAAFRKEAGDGTRAARSADSKDPDEMATLRAVGKALTAASAEVTEATEAAAALGMGAGSPGSNDPRSIATLYRRIRNDPSLRRICELAGRFRRVAQSRQRRKLLHGSDDVVGVTLDGDIGRMLPHELARLALPECEDDVLRRLVERQVLSRDYRASEPVGKGPIVVAVDESGSMEGEPVHTAKALALAMAWIARQQRRWAALVAYSGDSGERLLALPPGRWDEPALLDWLSAFIGRGSTLDVPVREMPRIHRELWAPSGATDVLFVTDCRCTIPVAVSETFLAWKRTVSARLWTLVLGDQAGDLATISDEIHLVRTLDVREEGVERVLAL
jgi:uncharacterized protein with von Willebrand factor type A (vWA) domain